MQSLRKDEEGNINNVDVIVKKLGSHHPRYETHADLFKRV